MYSMNEESKEALKKYNLEALQKFQNRKVQEPLCCLDEPTPNPGAAEITQKIGYTNILIFKSNSKKLDPQNA